IDEQSLSALGDASHEPLAKPKADLLHPLSAAVPSSWDEHLGRLVPEVDSTRRRCLNQLHGALGDEAPEGRGLQLPSDLRCHCPQRFHLLYTRGQGLLRPCAYGDLALQVVRTLLQVRRAA